MCVYGSSLLEEGEDCTRVSEDTVKFLTHQSTRKDIRYVRIILEDRLFSGRNLHS